MLTDKVNIIVDCRMVNKSGIGVYIANIISQLNTSCYPISIAILNKSTNATSISDINTVIVNSSIYTLEEQFELPTAIKKSHLFWSPHYNIPLFPIRSKKRLVTIHDVNHLQPWFRNTSYKGYLKSKLAEFLIKQALKKSDQVITVSQFTKQELLNRFTVSPEKITVIPLGIDHHCFRLYSRFDIEKITASYAISNDYIIYLGNVKPHKNIARLILAFSDSNYLQKKAVTLIIVGEKEKFLGQNHLLDETYSNLPVSVKSRIKFTGFVPDKDLPKLLAGAKLMVFPSLYEGFGLPPLEAMACGCPTVVSNAGSIPEVCGNASIYFDPYDTNEITAAIEKMLSDEPLRQNYIQKGLQHVKSFNWEKSGEEHLKIIKSMIAV